MAILSLKKGTPSIIPNTISIYTHGYIVNITSKEMKKMSTVEILSKKQFDEEYPFFAKDVVGDEIRIETTKQMVSIQFAGGMISAYRCDLIYDKVLNGKVIGSAAKVDIKRVN